jgi:hypothetical protein
MRRDTRPSLALGQDDFWSNMLMDMSRLPESVLQHLETVAAEVGETFAADGHKIDIGLGAHSAFGADNNRSRSDLTRDLLVWAMRPAASREGLNPGSGPGGCFELRAYLEDEPRCLVMRLRTAEQTANGGYRILAGNASMNGLECEGLWLDEPWVLGFTRTDDGLGALFVAEVVGITENRVPQLILGPVTVLTARPTLPPPDGFPQDEDDLEGFPGDEDELGDDFGESEAS